MEKIIAVALSGGIDSTVAALLLRYKYKNLVGASHYIWPESRCCSVKAFNRAKYISRQLHIPYYIIDLSIEFKEKVVRNFITTYIKGMTPNPCVLCNEEIRFTLFYDRIVQKLKQEDVLKKEASLFFATGHYARIKSNNGDYFLRRGRDQKKDQSYMLYRIPKEQLSKLIFPLGSLTKQEVIKVAREHNIVSKVEESQDACFVNGDYTNFIVSQTGKDDLKKQGNIIDLTGKIIGQHHGYIHYTIGQRRGLGLGDGPWYVTAIKPKQNLVMVTGKQEAQKNYFFAEKLNWFIKPPLKPLDCSVKIRYQTRNIDCKIIMASKDRVKVQLKKGEFITPGQSAVFYVDDLVLGGGIITPFKS